MLDAQGPLKNGGSPPLQKYISLTFRHLRVKVYISNPYDLTNKETDASLSSCVKCKRTAMNTPTPASRALRPARHQPVLCLCSPVYLCQLTRSAGRPLFASSSLTRSAGRPAPIRLHAELDTNLKRFKQLEKPTPIYQRLTQISPLKREKNLKQRTPPFGSILPSFPNSLLTGASGHLLSPFGVPRLRGPRVFRPQPA